MEIFLCILLQSSVLARLLHIPHAQYAVRILILLFTFGLMGFISAVQSAKAGVKLGKNIIKFPCLDATVSPLLFLVYVDTFVMS